MGSQPPTENEAKGAESESDEPSLDRFNSLAKGLFGVSREDLKKAQDRAKGAAVDTKPRNENAPEVPGR